MRKNNIYISRPVKKIKGSLEIIITIDNVANCIFMDNIEIKNVISGYSTHIDFSVGIDYSNLYLIVYLTKNGELHYYERIDYDDHDDSVFKNIPISFDKKIIYVTGNNKLIYVITNDGDVYQSEICSNIKKFHKLDFVDKMKSIHCFKEYTIFLSKTNKVEFLNF